MRYLTLAALAVAATTATASADPVRLTDGQMDQVSAGLLDNLRLNAQIAAVIQAAASITANTVASVGILAEDVNAVGDVTVQNVNTTTIHHSSTLSSSD